MKTEQTRFDIEQETGEILFPPKSQQQLCDALTQLRVAMVIAGIDQMTFIVNASSAYGVDVGIGRKDKQGAHAFSFGGSAENVARALAEHVGQIHFDRPVDVLNPDTSR